MSTLADLILISVVLINLVLLGTGRLRPSIRLVASQGVLLGTLPLLVSSQGPGARLGMLALVTIALKGVVFPRLLFRSLRSTNAKHEVTPLVGLTASILLGLVLLVGSFWLASRFRLPAGVVVASELVLPVALATIMCGLFLIITRLQALSQVLGYLVLENGIFVFGIALAHEEPFLVEMGILLDVFVAVFVMGIAIFHISREFDHIDVQQLSQLKDW